MEQYTSPDGSTRYRMTQDEFNEKYPGSPRATRPALVPNSPVPTSPEMTAAYTDSQKRQAALAQGSDNEFLRGLAAEPQRHSGWQASTANQAGNLARDFGIIGATIIVAIYLLRFLARILRVAIRLWWSFANTIAGTRLGGWWTKILRDE